jgi:hypothetical protein
MTSGPTPAQLAADQRGEGMPIVGAHSVGVEDDGPGLPVTGLSTVGGDLRVAHFFGLHGLQALPLLGFLLANFGPVWLCPVHRVALVWTAGLTYLGFVLILTWQALRGVPVVAPDAPPPRERSRLWSARPRALTNGSPSGDDLLRGFHGRT